MRISTLLIVLFTMFAVSFSNDSAFIVSNLDDATFLRMQKDGSYPKGCTVKRSNLRLLKVMYYDYEGKPTTGELVCNKAIATNLKEIFFELYKAKYPIESIRLIDDFNADDETSMRHNNTSCFCYRTVKGSRRLSKHSLGMAIDINPLHNPCVKYDSKGNVRKLQPNTPEARKYLNRTSSLPHIITRQDLCYRLFKKHGFRWGGAWKHTKDYQHFEK